MRKVANDESSFLGISIIINGLETHNIGALFRLFEKIFEKIVVEEKIIYFNNEGIIVFKDIDLSDKAIYLESITTLIKQYINQGDSNFIQILPLNYDISIDDSVSISITDGDLAIRDCIRDNNFIFVTKGSKIISADLNGLRVRLVHLNEQIEYLKNYNNEHTISNKGFKNYKIWMCISIVLAITLLLLFFKRIAF